MLSQDEKKGLKIYLSSQFEVKNAVKYTVDQEELGFSKLCMTEVVNADLVIASVGEEPYFAACKEILESVQHALVMAKLDSVVHLYTYNYKNFMLAAADDISNDDFLNLVRKFYEQFEFAQSQKTELSSISRFVVVLSPKNMLERAKNAFHKNANSSDNFIIATEEDVSPSMVKKDFTVIELLNRAVLLNKVVPYFQGIYNNEKKCIDKYEALMRIVDSDGTVYSPFYFLDAAKRYKFYNKISMMLVEKALIAFENVEESVSINLSLYDIQSESFRHWFLERMKNYPDPSRVAIEFVETEDYQNDENVFHFINTLRATGCKFSADDFGAGYSNYAAIIGFNPDFIKIDGSIIKDIVQKEQNLIIFKSICYMANLIKAKIVAEFVENAEIQEVVEREGAIYSQGYHFAAPMPLEKITLTKTVKA